MIPETKLRNGETVAMQPLREFGSHYSCPYCTQDYTAYVRLEHKRISLPQALEEGLVDAKCFTCYGWWLVPFRAGQLGGETPITADDGHSTAESVDQWLRTVRQ